MQRDFVDGALGTKEAAAIVPAVKAKLDSCRKDGWTVIFTRDTHPTHYMDTQEGKNLPVPHCIQGTPGWEIIPELSVEDSLVLDKPTFGSLGLVHYAAKCQDLDEIQLIGLCTDICVIFNALLLKAALPEVLIISVGCVLFEAGYPCYRLSVPDLPVSRNSGSHG